MEFKNKKVLVIGLARSGLAAIKLLHRLGANVTLTERKNISELEELDLLREMNVEIVPQSDEVFERDFDLVVKNPGVSPLTPFVKRLEERKIKIITEIELGYMVSKPQHYLVITGTNGKTTSTTLTYEILNKAFPGKAHLCGNVGTPLCDVVMDYDLINNEGHYLAVEISQGQLIDIDTFTPDVAVILNLSPDHIDFMGGLDNYYHAKTLIYKNMKGNNVFLLNEDDEIVKEYTKRYPINCDIKTFSLYRDDTDCFMKDGYMYLLKEKSFPLENIKIVGIHNKRNVMIPSTMAKLMGVSNEVIAQAVSEFKGVEHRIEFVREINGVRYYNDSKGTNTDATIIALNSFDRGVILLVGGHEKGLDMECMKPHMGCVKKVIGFGAAGRRIASDLVGDEAIIVNDLVEAVNEANKYALSGDTVLLSPTTSSFDQYSCFEERGEHFKEIVNSL